MIEAQASKTFDASLEGAASDLVGSIGVRVIDGPSQTTVVPRTTAGIAEYPAGSGVYSVELTAPAAPGHYLVLWDQGEPLTPAATFTEELVVYAGPPPAAGHAAGMLASVEELKRYLRTAGTVSAGASLDETLLGDLLAAASSRIIGALPERTLIPDAPDAEPVEVRIPYAGGRIVQVPDLRELVTFNGAAYVPGAVPGVVTGPTLIRRPREVCSLWLQFGTAPVWTTPGELVLVGRWGPAGMRIGDPIEVNAGVREAALVWASRAYHNRTARYADTVQDPQGGVSSYFRNLPPDVKATVDALTIPGL